MKINWKIFSISIVIGITIAVLFLLYVGFPLLDRMCGEGEGIRYSDGTLCKDIPPYPIIRVAIFGMAGFFFVVSFLICYLTPCFLLKNKK